ncbi:MAG: RDD family protein [Planctomycetota bacterium]
MAEADSRSRFPSPWRRFAAFAVDYVVLAVFIAVISAVFALLPSDLVASLFATPLRGQLTGLLVLTVPVWLYFALCEQSSGQATIGKRVMSLIVQGVDGRRMSLGQSLLRSGIKLVPWELAHTCLWRIEGWPAPEEPPHGWQLGGLVLVWVLVGLFLVPLFTTARHRSMYDVLARTLVVRRETGSS